MKYYLFILGCQMNYSDAERIASILQSLGYKETKDINKSDLVIAVACSVRQKAIDRIWGLVKKFHQLSTKNKELRTILTGCVLPADRLKLAKHFDIVFNIKDLNSLPDMLSKNIDEKFIDVEEENSFLKKNYLEIEPYRRSPFQAYVPISTGCNNFCSYCAVPYTRGQEISRPADEIICEVKNLVKRGYKEIILLGQNVNSYRCKIKSQKSKVKNTSQNSKIITFPDLLKMINNIRGNFWIRFLTSHPKDMSIDLIKTIAECEKLTPYIHLPVQSGNNEILKKMNRHYTAQHYLKLISKLKSPACADLPASKAGASEGRQIPNLSLSTDVIVGFPGETRKQFEDTANLMKKVGFDMAYISCYSPRPGTMAFKLKDNVSKREKKSRKNKLNEILKKTALENNKKYLGKITEVLVESCKGNKNSTTYKLKKLTTLIGRTKNFKLVQFSGPKDLIGQFTKVKITKCTPWALEGKLIK